MADFPLTLQCYPVQYAEEGFKTAFSRGYGGKERRDSIVSVSRRTFSYPVKLLTLAQAKSVWDFVQARKGAFESFNLTIKDENGNNTVFVVRFESDTFTYTWSESIWYDIGILKFIEDK